MKKITIALLTALILGSAQAEYTIKIPLDADAIAFKEPQPPAVPAGPWDCINQAAVYPEECDKRLSTWNDFAITKGIHVYTWQKLSASNKGIFTLPTEPYPSTTINGPFMLSGNQLKNLDSLINITTICCGSFGVNFSNNRLQNVDGLSNVMESPQLNLQNNMLSNINGLKNIKVNNGINIDSDYSGPKLSASSRFCTLNPPENFVRAKKDQLCESP